MPIRDLFIVLRIKNFCESLQDSKEGITAGQAWESSGERTKRMPGQKPVLKTGFHTGKFRSALRHSGLVHLQTAVWNSQTFLKLRKSASTFKRGLMAGSALTSTTLTSSLAHAQSVSISQQIDPSLLTLDTNAILMLAVFGGAMSFALLSAFWMIRERTRIVDENQKLKLSLADLRALNDRNEALVNIPGQRLVVWNGTEERPVILGDAPEKSTMPSEESAFLAFGKWLDPVSAQQFEPLLRNLRLDAKAFDTVLRSKRGGLFEVRGSTSGSFAFVRFTDLHGEREEHARLKNKHENLQQTFGSFESLMQRLPMPIWLRDREGALTWVNRAYSDALEAENPKATVEKNLDLFDPELRDRIASSRDENDLFSGEVPVTVAGDRRKLEVFNVRSDQGSAGIAVDKSDVDHIRRMLDEANDGQARMLDQMATAVAIFDEGKKLTFYNSGFQQLWKLDASFLDSQPSNGELLDAMRDAKLLPEHPDWKKWRDGQLEVYQALEPIEEWWHLLDGQTVRVVASPRNQGGSTWVFENVTERLALESNYNALMRVQGETLDHLNEAVAVFGLDGKLKLFNPALEQLWRDADLDVAEGLHITAIIEKWTDSISNESDLQAILGKITGFDDARDDLEGRMELRNGSTLDYSVVPLPDGQSMITMVDVTASVNFEKALRERAEALEASDLLKSKFIQHVSYELRAPLTSISGFGELLATPEIGDMNSKQEEYLGHINSAASVLKTLVDDILDLASIDAGTMQVEPKEIQFTQRLDEVLISFADEMKYKGLSVDVVTDEKAGGLHADPERLHQILHNLVSNAVNFSPDGGKILVAGKTVSDAFEIRVSDDGPGIAPSEREKVFDRFEARSATGGRQGTGLGLSLVRGFVEMHGGSVTIEESASGGACFVCSFPKQISSPAGEADASAAA